MGQEDYNRGGIMADNTVISPFLGTFMTLAFVFSTIYTAAYYFSLGSSQQLGTQGLSDTPNDPASLVGSLADWVLEGASWISPFGLVKLLLTEIMASTPELYTAVNLLVLRPVGWVVALFTANYIISKIPTVSGET